MFLPTTISDAAVETAFVNFGKVHYVRAGTYGKDFGDIKNGKGHVRITPYSGKSGFPHQIVFEEISRSFNVKKKEKEIECKFCVMFTLFVLIVKERRQLIIHGLPMGTARLQFPGTMKSIGLTVSPRN